MGHQISMHAINQNTVGNLFEGCCNHVDELWNELNRLEQLRDLFEEKYAVTGTSDYSDLTTFRVLSHHYSQAENALKAFISNGLTDGFDSRENVIYLTDPVDIAEMLDSYHYYINYLSSIKEWVKHIMTAKGIEESQLQKRMQSEVYDEDDEFLDDRDVKRHDLDE